MTNYSLRPLTETSWILSLGDDRIGLVNKISNLFKIIGKLPKKSFASLEEMKEYLGGNLIIEDFPEQIEDPEIGEINGYPIKHTIWHNIESENILSYTRTKNSKVRYAAGYYGIKTNDRWSQNFCPKLTTLTDSNYIGPFKTKLEASNSISQKNQSKIL